MTLTVAGRAAVLWLGLGLPAGAVHAGYAERDAARVFIDEMVKRHEFNRSALQAAFASVERNTGILETIARPAERTLTWDAYRDIFLGAARVRQGAAFWRRHEAALARAERTYGVPPAVIVAILGVETRYGRQRGRYRVLEALATLAFDYPPRAEFFRGELEAFLLLAREEALAFTQPLGSYAGAMGYGQFIPSSYRSYAVDFDDDGRRDIWENPTDAIGSIANYLARHGWQRDAEVARRVTLTEPPDEALTQSPLALDCSVAELRARGVRGLDGLASEAEASLLALAGPSGPVYWVGLQNFYAITRYNHSRLYAMAVHELAEAVRSERGAALAGAGETRPEAS